MDVTEWAGVSTIGAAVVGLAGFFARAIAREETRKMGIELATLKALRGEDVGRLERMEHKIDRLLERAGGDRE